jgi:hyperosmotically inducible protein
MTLNISCKKSISTLLIIGGLSAGFGMGSAFADDAAPDPGSSNSMVSALSDASITTELKARLLGMKGLRSADIQVTTTDGTVELSGIVPSVHAKSIAMITARNIDGVKHVTDMLTVSSAPGRMQQAIAKSEMVVSDSWITSKVKSELLADDMTKGFAVSVAAQDGVVTLQGQLDSQAAINRTKTLAESVKGVKYLDTSALMISTQQ